MKKAVIGLSGGMDSATLLGFLLEQGLSVHCVSVLYGSKHSVYEMEAAKNIVAFYNQAGNKVTHEFLDLRSSFSSFSSNLLVGQGNIPEGHYNDASMKQTVVPGRNLIIAAYLAGIAESMKYNYICLGVHSGDHFIYPDCRPEFIENLGKTVSASSENAIHVLTPFIHMDKESILEVGLKINVPYNLTRTCYKDQKLSCGKCGSCRERLEAFEKLGINDFITYE